MSHLQNLPVSLITSIVSYLPPVDIDKIPQLSKWFHQTIFQDGNDHFLPIFIPIRTILANFM